MKIGETITVNDTKLLVLDFINENPFVICLDTGIKTKFSPETNNYKTSILRTKAETWLKKRGFKTIPRVIDLITMNGYTGYGEMEVDVAPLTFDEYRKYTQILTPHIQEWFWTATGWYVDLLDTNMSNFVCVVLYSGTADYGSYWGSFELAPAFILDKDSLNI